jgi:UDP-N-acetylglucosamine acyltransferase
MPIDPGARVAPTARIHPDAVIGPGTVIGEYVVIEQDVVIGANCLLEPHVYIKRWTTLGDANEISAGTVLGTDPLDKNFRGQRSFLRIGHRNRIREHFTISRATKEDAATIIGNDNYIMTSGHIAHDCQLGNGIVICSCTLLAGYVQVEDLAFLSGGVVVHQFSRIGKLAMIGGNTRVNQDLPPYFLYSDFNVAAKGINVVGLKRNGFTMDDIRALKSCYRTLYREGLKLEDACARLAALGHPLAQHIVDFIQSSRRGIVRE